MLFLLIWRSTWNSGQQPPDWISGSQELSDQTGRASHKQKKEPQRHILIRIEAEKAGGESGVATETFSKGCVELANYKLFYDRTDFPWHTLHTCSTVVFPWRRLASVGWGVCPHVWTPCQSVLNKHLTASLYLIFLQLLKMLSSVQLSHVSVCTWREHPWFPVS